MNGMGCIKEMETARAIEGRCSALCGAYSGRVVYPYQSIFTELPARVIPRFAARLVVNTILESRCIVDLLSAEIERGLMAFASMWSVFCDWISLLKNVEPVKINLKRFDQDYLQISW